MLNQERGLGRPVLLVDGGDCFFSGPTKKAPTPAEESYDMRRARLLINAYNLMGYQALGIGPGDLQHGIANLRRIEKEARFPFICSNLVEKAPQGATATGGGRKTLFQRHTVIESGGIRFGIFALLLPQMSEAYTRRAIPEADVLDPGQVAAEVVPELRKACDIVLLLSQLNVEGTEQIVASTPGIDVVLDPISRSGSKAIWVTEGEYCTTLPSAPGVPILRVDGQGSRMGIFEMHFLPGSRKFDAFRGYDSPLEPHIMKHPEMAQLVQEFDRGRSQPWTFPTDASKPRLTEDLMGHEACGGCHEDQQKFWMATKHAAAYATLEKTRDHLRQDCIACHTLGYGVSFAETAAVGGWKEVQCESCHAPKKGHAENPKLVRFGAVSEETCWGCHNPAITKKDFDYTSSRPLASCPKMTR
jgi:hypothetical protein